MSSPRGKFGLFSCFEACSSPKPSPNGPNRSGSEDKDSKDRNARVVIIERHRDYMKAINSTLTEPFLEGEEMTDDEKEVRQIQQAGQQFFADYYIGMKKM